MPWARASSLGRFMACQAASWLPRWDDSKGEMRRPYLLSRGLWDAGARLEAEAVVLNPTLLQVRDKRAADLGRQRHAEKERGEFHPEMYTGMAQGWHEISVSYCCKTGKVRWLCDVDERRRDLWKAMQCEHAVTGTADWMGILKDGTPWVDDLKTGWQTPEVLTAQTMFYSMCLSDLVDQGVSRFGGATPGAVMVSITHQPRGKGLPTREGLWRRVTPLMIEAFRQELTDAWTVTTVSTRPTAGPHCDWCPSAAWCPEALATD